MCWGRTGGVSPVEQAIQYVGAFAALDPSALGSGFGAQDTIALKEPGFGRVIKRYARPGQARE
ncbi:hypothetical protein KIPB_012865, partial [Kipferlia bialata]|eukprot:g12865.t1